MLVFLLVTENIVLLCPSFLLFSPTHNARSLQENNARSAANQSTRTIVAK